ncbi:hypothetical protein ACF0H5_004549 [Mactra antiquata]
MQKMILLLFDRYQRLISVQKDRDSEFSFAETKELFRNQSEEDNDFNEEKSEERPITNISRNGSAEKRIPVEDTALEKQHRSNASLNYFQNHYGVVPEFC